MFQVLQDLLKEEETTMEENWKGIEEALTSTCQEVLGLKKHHHNEWISIETPDRIKERKNEKTAINNSRTRAELALMDSPDIEAAQTDLPIDVNPPTTEEIRMAIRQIKSGRAAGTDNIPAEELNSEPIRQFGLHIRSTPLSHTHEQMQTKTTHVVATAVSASVDLNIHKGKTKVLKFKTKNSNPVTLDREILEDVESFIYLGSIIDEQGGSNADVKERIGKARTAILQLKNI
ncbi:unnamed protein product [Schistosoma mattheei]|uniref:Uncharacterized protein n=1 Tax=Schistosoma mattheei TaxID=31246 RepID=A0A183NYR0_9TREM|nr:unnamed protein product [Schistosoma mattheei]